MNIDEKIDNIKKALNIEYKYFNYGFDLLKIKIIDDPNIDDSEFRSEDLSIVFKESYFNNASLHELVSQSFHEARHFYQYVQINFRDELLNKNIYVEDIELINRWSNEFKNYKRPSGNIDLDYEFLDQDIELDAMTFAYYLTLKLFNLKLYIPKYIEERFYNRLEKFEKIYG